MLTLTSVADGGRSSWFLSELQAAELSALCSADDRQCCCQRFCHPKTAAKPNQTNCKVYVNEVWWNEKEWDFFFKFSPSPAGCQPSSPQILAGGHPCPDCLGCEEPGWRQPSQQPEPEKTPAPTCPCWGTAEEVERWRQAETPVAGHTCWFQELLRNWLLLFRFGEVLFELCPVAVTSSLGLIYASECLAGGPQETRRMMLMYKGKWATRSKKNHPLIWDVTRSI